MSWFDPILNGLLALLLLPAPYAHGKLAERDDFHFLQVLQVSDNPIRLRVRADHFIPSATFVSAFLSRPMCKVEGDQVLFKCNLGGFKHWANPFDFTIELPPNVKKLVVGKERKEIWPIDRKFSNEERRACDVAFAELRRVHPEFNREDFYVDPVGHSNVSPTSSDIFSVLITRIIFYPRRIEEQETWECRVSKVDYSVHHMTKWDFSKSPLFGDLGQRSVPEQK